MILNRYTISNVKNLKFIARQINPLVVPDSTSRIVAKIIESLASYQQGFESSPSKLGRLEDTSAIANGQRRGKGL